MENFEYFNPVKIVFGKGTIEKLENLIPASQKILLAYGGGSIKKNGVYDQVMESLKGRAIVEFSGIEANPRYETLMKAAQICREQKVDFILSVGGGSVLDGVKFIALAACYDQGDPWDILSKNAPASKALPLGCVMTLPATGSEMNMFAVISRNSTTEKLAFATPLVFPQFSILDPETTYSLPERQVINGITDAIVHVMEQYMTFSRQRPAPRSPGRGHSDDLDRGRTEGVKNAQGLHNSSEPGVERHPGLKWGSSVAAHPQDWTTHMIGHEINRSLRLGSCTNSRCCDVRRVEKSDECQI